MALPPGCGSGRCAGLAEGATPAGALASLGQVLPAPLSAGSGAALPLFFSPIATALLISVDTASSTAGPTSRSTADRIADLICACSAAPEIEARTPACLCSARVAAAATRCCRPAPTLASRGRASRTTAFLPPSSPIAFSACSHSRYALGATAGTFLLGVPWRSRLLSTAS